MVIMFIALSTYTVFLDTQTSSSQAPANRNQGEISATLPQQSAGTQTLQTETLVQQFGNQYFEPPSGILIPANTLTWTNFRFNETSKVYVAGGINFFPFPVTIPANITVAIYLDGVLSASSTTYVPSRNYEMTSSSIPTSTSANSIFALTGLIPTVSVGTQSTSALNVYGVTVSVAILSDKPVWLAGWTPTDMSGGTGPQFGQSIGQLAGIYEASLPSTSLPGSLPQATAQPNFEFQFSGGLWT
jgi:hypothetical protein